jgi:hypothetical protein
MANPGRGGYDRGSNPPRLSQAVSWIALQAKSDNAAIRLTPFEHSPHPSARSIHFRLMARRKYRSIPFSYAGRQLEARAVPATGSWEIWIYEYNRALTCYAFIDMRTVKDAERYNLDLLGDEMSATIEAVKARHLIIPLAS